MTDNSNDEQYFNKNAKILLPDAAFNAFILAAIETVKDIVRDDKPTKISPYIHIMAQPIDGKLYEYVSKTYNIPPSKLLTETPNLHHFNLAGKDFLKDGIGTPLCASLVYMGHTPKQSKDKKTRWEDVVTIVGMTIDMRCAGAVIEIDRTANGQILIQKVHTYPPVERTDPPSTDIMAHTDPLLAFFVGFQAGLREQEGLI